MTSSPTHDSKRRALGRGLETLLPPKPPALASQTTEMASGSPLEIPLDRIERNPFQTRTHFDETLLDELARSIRESGVVQPIIVRPVRDGWYQLIAGERRLLASSKAGKSTVPAVVRQATDVQAIEMNIVENLQRTDLNPMEQARAYQRLGQEFKLTQEQIATRTGKERASVANFLRLLRLPEQVQTRVESGELAFGHARTLLALETPEQIAAAAQKVISLAMSVRQTETYVQGLLNPEAKPGKGGKAAPPQDPNVREAQDRLQRRLGLKVHIEDRKGKGRVIIEYAGLEDFDALLAQLSAAEDSPSA